MSYFSAVLAFIAVLVGIRGYTWDPKRRRLTPFGWATIAIAAASTLVSVTVAYRDRAASNRDRMALDWQTSQRAKVRAVALVDLQEALDAVVFPFGLLWENAEHKLDSLEFNSERFYHDPDYLVAKLREPAFREAWSRFDLRRDPEYPNLYPSSTWGVFFSSSATQADDMFEGAIAKYSAYLETDDLLKVHELRSDEFFRMRLKELPVLVKANDHLKVYPVAFAFRGPDQYASYLRFVDKVEALARGLPPRLHK